eukprot:UN00518
MSSYTTEELLDIDSDHDIESGSDELYDIALDEDEEEEKYIVLPHTCTPGMDLTGELNNSETDDPQLTEGDEKYPTFTQRNFTFGQHGSIWADDIAPASILSFLFMICCLIAYMGYSMSEGGNRFIAGIGAFSIWSILTLVFIFFDRKNSEHKTNKQLTIKNTNQHNNDDYKPYYSDDDDGDDNLLR